MNSEGDGGKCLQSPKCDHACSLRVQPTLLSDDAAACERARLRILAGREASTDVLNALVHLMAAAERCFGLTESGEREKVAAMDEARKAIAKYLA